MDDKKSSAGLGELYEKEFVRAAAGGSAEDKDDPIRQVDSFIPAALVYISLRFLPSPLQLLCYGHLFLPANR